MSIPELRKKTTKRYRYLYNFSYKNISKEHRVKGRMIQEQKRLEFFEKFYNTLAKVETDEQVYSNKK